ncbi:MAG TPA: hypothetical protein QF353_02520 [Gammaproteobacteria bacterium]|nr:hypothetical protein [Gammaproteobacteria bacterium]
MPTDECSSDYSDEESTTSKIKYHVNQVAENKYFKFFFGFLLVGISSGSGILGTTAFLKSFVPPSVYAASIKIALDTISYVMFTVLSYYWGAIYYDSFQNTKAEDTGGTKTEILAFANSSVVNSFGMMFTGLGLISKLPVTNVAKYFSAGLFWVTGFLSANKLTANSIREFYNDKKGNSAEWRIFLKRFKPPTNVEQIYNWFQSFSAVIFGLSIACLNYVANLACWEILRNPRKLLDYKEVVNTINKGNYGLGHQVFATMGGLVTFMAVVPLIHSLLPSKNKKDDKKDDEKDNKEITPPGTVQNITKYLASIVNTVILGVFVFQTLSTPALSFTAAFYAREIFQTLAWPSIYYYSLNALFEMSNDKFMKPLFVAKELGEEIIKSLNGAQDWVYNSCSSIQKWALQRYQEANMQKIPSFTYKAVTANQLSAYLGKFIPQSCSDALVNIKNTFSPPVGGI